MIFDGVLLAVLSGTCNGLFTAPMKLASRWKWENIWLVFILVSCWLMPPLLVPGLTGGASAVLANSPPAAVRAALAFGFAWGFGAICFGLSVDRLGVSLANSLVIGLSSAFGSLVPLFMQRLVRFDPKELVLFAGVATFLAGVAFCGKAGRIRDGGGGAAGRHALWGYVLAIVSGLMSAVFNIGYTLALPITSAGVALGLSPFAATNYIWLLMLGAGAVPNLAYCLYLLRKNGTGRLFAGRGVGRPFGLSIAMGLLWGGSIFLYGAATPRLGELGPSVGWPLSLATGLLVANLMGLWLGEWKGVDRTGRRAMQTGILLILGAVILCSISSRISS
jgi:L-rhamnose-H+ transport protein